MAVPTWAPRGQTPILRVRLTRDHLAAIGMVLQVQDHAYRSQAVVRLLRLLQHKIVGQLLSI